MTTHPHRPDARPARSHRRPRATSLRRLVAAAVAPVATGGLVIGLPSTQAIAAPAPAVATAISTAAVQSVAFRTAATQARPTLRYGSRSSAVKDLQRRLGVRPVSGYFGSRTLAAVKRYQRTHNLPVTGVVARLTWGKLLKQSPRASRSTARVKRFVLPVPAGSYRLTARFNAAGGHWAHRHTGLDFAAPTGTRVLAVAPGRIVSAGWAGAYGYRIVVDHGNGYQTWYCHLSRIARGSGLVGAGTRIGSVGATGNVTGPHLHFESRYHGRALNPDGWLRNIGLRP